MENLVLNYLFLHLDSIGADLISTSTLRAEDKRSASTCEYNRARFDIIIFIRIESLDLIWNFTRRILTCRY